MSVQSIISKLRDESQYDAQFVKDLKESAQSTYIVCLTILKIVSKIAFAVWVTTLILRVTEITIPIPLVIE